MQELIGAKELAKILKVNPQTIYNWVSKKKIPHIKIGDLVRFDLTAITLWIQKKTHYPDRVKYKGFEIEACPFQPTGIKKWTVSIKIIDFSNTQPSKHYTSKDQFSSKKEAIKKCFQFGKKIIDGEVIVR